MGRPRPSEILAPFARTLFKEIAKCISAPQLEVRLQALKLLNSPGMLDFTLGTRSRHKLAVSLLYPVIMSAYKFCSKPNEEPLRVVIKLLMRCYKEHSTAAYNEVADGFRSHHRHVNRSRQQRLNAWKQLESREYKDPLPDDSVPAAGTPSGYQNRRRRLPLWHPANRAFSTQYADLIADATDSGGGSSWGSGSGNNPGSPVSSGSWGANSPWGSTINSTLEEERSISLDVDEPDHELPQVASSRSVFRALRGTTSK